MSTAVQTANSTNINTLIKHASVASRFNEVLGKKAPAFISSLLSLVNNSDLKLCEPPTVISSAMMAATLDLPINKNLGFAYIISYKNSKTNTHEAQFQMGYKGFVQLAIRSGQIEQLNVAVLGKSQFKGYDPIEDVVEKNLADTSDLTSAAYIGKLKLVNGFTKYLVMTVENLKNHALKYSQNYKYYINNNGKGKDKSGKEYNLKEPLWISDFDEMAKKTVIKLLLSKYAPLSATMQQAILKTKP